MKNIAFSAYLLALHSIDGLGPMRLKILLDYFKDPKLAWEADRKKFEELTIPQNTLDLLIETRRNLDPEEYLKSIEKSGIKWVTIFDENYPKPLREIYDPPIVLYYKGQILPQDEKAVAVVGTRKMTGYGKVVTEKFVADLVISGVSIVSGLARGVDSTAHWAALEQNGRTLAVLGGGINVIYPPENTNLAEKIAQAGAIFSEFPPDYPSLPGNFPSRNRIIAGLSKAILVTEAAEDSGSLITARLALEQGKDVFAVPGPITSNLSKGPINLIKDGARPVFEASEILQELGWDQGGNLQVTAQVLAEISAEERKIVDCLQNTNMHIDEICRQLQFSAAFVSATLLTLEIKGVVKNLGGGLYCKVI